MGKKVLVVLHTNSDGMQILYDALEYKLQNTKSTEEDSDEESITRLANEWNFFHAIGDMLNEINGHGKYTGGH